MRKTILGGKRLNSKGREYLKNKEILKYYPIADYIAAINGLNCEVIIHDISDLKHSIVRIVNGNITGRKVGCSITNYALELLQKYDNSQQNYVVNYLGTTHKKKRILRSSTYFIRNYDGKIIGFLCVNIDISDLLKMKDSIDNMILINESKRTDHENVGRENFDMTVDELVNVIIQSVILESGTKLMESSQEQKIKLIKKMYDKGVFKFKGAVDTLSKIFDISTQSIYRYLKEIEKN